MSFSFLLMMLTLGAGVTEAGKLVYAASQTQVEFVVCPGGDQQCPDGTTCCERTSGGWACCPHVEATCCSDHVHCCPKGTTCDVERARCVHDTANKTVTWAKKLSASFKSEQAVVRPGNEICPSGLPCPGKCCKSSLGLDTCCLISGCCPGITGCCTGGSGRRKSTAYAAKVEWSLIGDEDN